MYFSKFMRQCFLLGKRLEGRSKLVTMNESRLESVLRRTLPRHTHFYRPPS